MKQRILVLDDNLDILDIIQEVLSYEDFDVLCVSRINHFYEHLADWKPDLLILDFKLADGNGGDICRQLKDSPETCDIPIIMFSAYVTGQEDLYSYGCDAVITKPFNLEELRDKIRGTLSAC
jgi:DNA-binding response OmpR family regulator